jgi:hypothetical protein
MRDIKTFVKHYFIADNQNDKITVKWKTGLSHFEVHHNDELLETFKGSAEIVKGVTIYSEKLGNIFVRMLQKPLGFEVKLGDRYITNSRIFAEERLTSVSAILYFIGVISFIFTIGVFFISVDEFSRNWFNIFKFVCVAISSFYILSGYLVRKGHIWAYFSATTLFSAITIFYIATIGWPLILLHTVRLSFLAIIISQIKHMIDLHKHNRAIRNLKGITKNQDLLDNIDIG